MLSDNIKAIRKARGLSQEELAIKLNVVRQTVSKWERGLSVPDSDLLISLADALDVSVSTLLGEGVGQEPADDLKALAQKLEVVNLQLARRRETGRKVLRGLLVAVCVAVVAVFACLAVFDSPYLGWDYGDPETAVVGVALHAFEWLFVRLGPIALIGAIIGLVLTRKRA